MSDYASPGFVNIDGEIFKLYVEPSGDKSSKPLDPSVNIRQLKTYPGKELQGDPTVRSHDYLSTWGISDQSGGLGVIDHRAGQTDQRFRRASADVSRPAKWTTAPKVRQATAPAGVVWIWGDLWESTQYELYCSGGTDIFQWDEATLEWIDTGVNIGSVPVNMATAFAGTGSERLFIPRGASGYSIWDGTAITDVAAAGSTQPAAVDFWIFGQTNFMCISTDGRIWSSIDGVAWDPYDDIRIDASSTPYGGLEHRDLAGEPLSYINTSRGVYTFDPFVPALYGPTLKLTRHITSGRAAEVWEGFYYISAAVDVREFNGTENRPVGLDADDGIPNAQGNTMIVALAGSNNDLYALVKGDSAADGALSAVYRRDGAAWFEVWRSTEGVAAPVVQSMVVSNAQNGHRLHWGESGASRHVWLEIGDHNPKRLLLERGWTEFEDEGEWYGGFWDAGMPGSDKVAVSMAVRLGFIVPDLETPVFPEFGFRRTEDEEIEDFGSFFAVLLDGQFEEPVLPASGSIPDATYFYRFSADRRGVHFDELEPWANITKGCVVKWMAIYYMRQMAGSYGWTMTFDMTGIVNGKSPLQQRQILEALVEEGSVYQLGYVRQTYRAAFATWEGVQWSGIDEDRGLASVTMFEVRERP